jgi:hypothetical protein
LVGNDPLDRQVKEVQVSGLQGFFDTLAIEGLADEEVFFTVSNPKEQRDFLGQRRLELEKPHGQFAPTDLDRLVGDLRKRNSFLILQLSPDSFTNFIFGLGVILHFAASPISEYLYPEVLIFLEKIVYLECQVVLLIPEQDL